jgi:hypothetical protein
VYAAEKKSSLIKIITLARQPESQGHEDFRELYGLWDEFANTSQQEFQNFFTAAAKRLGEPSTAKHQTLMNTALTIQT